LQYIEVELARDDEHAISQLQSTSDDDIIEATPDYFERGEEVINLVIALTPAVIISITSIVKERIRANKHVKIKIRGGIEISGASLKNIEKLLRSIDDGN
jgi:hypothetical protein